MAYWLFVHLAHQLALSLGGLETYVLFEPRGNLISMNKEGIVSVPGVYYLAHSMTCVVLPPVLLTGLALGYLAIHLLGLSTGTLILPPSPSFFRRRQKEIQKLLKQQQRKRRLSDTHLSQQQLPKDEKDPLGLHREHDRTATELVSYSVVWWTLLGATKVLKIGSATKDSEVSRRMVQYFRSFSFFKKGFAQPKIRFADESPVHPLDRRLQHILPPRLSPA